jgi:membrane fusion protein, copper/silver efflux system
MRYTKLRFLISFVAALWLPLLLNGCDASAPSGAAVQEAPQPNPRLIHQGGGPVVLDLAGGQVPGMTLVEVRDVALPGVLETTGQVAFDDRRVSTIVSRVAGRIEATRVSQWDYVYPGERIVELYSPDFMTAAAEYLQAKTTSQLSSSPQMTASGGNLAAAMLSAAQRKLEFLGMSDRDIAAITAPSPAVWVRSPIGGTVVDNKATRGAAVNPGDVLYTVGTLDDVWVVADIYEDDLARVHVGQALQAVTTAFPDQSFAGVVSRISPNLDPNTHTLQIRCQILNPGSKLKPQMYARVRIVTRPGDALVVPQEAVVFDTNDYFVFVDLGGGHFERRKVTIGSWKEQGFARVLSGLSAGEHVVAAESIQINALWHEANGESS